MGSNFSFLCIWAFECLPLLNQSAETYPFSSDLESITASLMTLSFPVSLSVSPSSSSACTHLVPAGPLGIRQPRMRQGHLGQGWMAYRPSPPKDGGKHNPTSRSFCLWKHPGKWCITKMFQTETQLYRQSRCTFSRWTQSRLEYSWMASLCDLSMRNVKPSQLPSLSSHAQEVTSSCVCSTCGPWSQQGEQSSPKPSTSILWSITSSLPGTSCRGTPFHFHFPPHQGPCVAAP